MQVVLYIYREERREEAVAFPSSTPSSSKCIGSPQNKEETSRKFRSFPFQFRLLAPWVLEKNRSDFCVVLIATSWARN
jgi:hypothetical protein